MQYIVIAKSKVIFHTVCQYSIPLLNLQYILSTLPPTHSWKDTALMNRVTDTICGPPKGILRTFFEVPQGAIGPINPNAFRFQINHYSSAMAILSCDSFTVTVFKMCS